MIVTDQAYGSGTMIADDSNQIIAPTAHRSETYPQAIIDLPKLRQQRQKSWNFQQYRPDLHQLLLRQVPKSSSTPTDERQSYFHLGHEAKQTLTYRSRQESKYFARETK